MARPKKQGLEYFPLDVDFFDDEKMIAVSGKFGITGEIVTLRLLTAIYRRGYYMEWTELMGYKLIRFIDGLTQERLEDIISYLVKCEFFDRQMFEQHHILTSRGIQRRYFHSVSKRTLDEDLPYLLVTVTCNKTPSVPLPSPTPGYNMKTDDEVRVMIDDKEWCESIARLNNLSVEDVKLYLRRFATENCDANHKSPEDARSHVARWIRKILESNRGKESSRGKPVSGGLSGPRTSEAELRRRRDERQLKERLEREAHDRERQTATQYLKSKGLDPTTNIAELIRRELAREEEALDKDILPLADGPVKIRKDHISAKESSHQPAK